MKYIGIWRNDVGFFLSDFFTECYALLWAPCASLPHNGRERPSAHSLYGRRKFIATGFSCIYSLVNQINWTAKSILYSNKIIDYRNFDVTALHLLHWFCKPRCKSKELPTTTMVKRAASSGRFIIVGVEDWIVEKTSSSPVVCKSSEIHFLFCGTGIIYDEFKRPLLFLRY